jgi:hypothetical protein
MRPLAARCHAGLARLYRRTGRPAEADEPWQTATPRRLCQVSSGLRTGFISSTLRLPEPQEPALDGVEKGELGGGHGRLRPRLRPQVAVAQEERPRQRRDKAVVPAAHPDLPLVVGRELDRSPVRKRFVLRATVWPTWNTTVRSPTSGRSAGPFRTRATIRVIDSRGRATKSS